MTRNDTYLLSYFLYTYPTYFETLSKGYESQKWDISK